MPPPKSKLEVRRFLDMATYLQKFIKDLKNKSESLRRLTEKDQEFIWGKEQEKAHQCILKSLIEAQELAHYDPNKPVTLTVDEI